MGGALIVVPGGSFLQCAHAARAAHAMAALMLLLQLVQPAQGNAIVKSLPCTMLLQKRWRQLSLLACMRAC